MKIPLLEGRAFERKFATDSVHAVIVNQALAKLISSHSVVGREFSFENDSRIIGVMKDYHYQNIKNKIGPLALYLAPERVNYVIVRLTAGRFASSLKQVESTWQQVYPSYPFEYRFFDADFSQMFKADEQMATIFGYASPLAIFIACLGLLGLASFLIESRKGEISTRKILGASTLGIAFMLSREFIRWVVVADLVACPIAYVITRKLLEDYAYRTTISWWIFVIAALITLLITVFTVSFQAVKAARANPINALRYE